MNKNNTDLSFPKNVVGNLPSSELLVKEGKRPYLIKQAEDPRQKHSGMTLNFRGFTLIELLVVVLIIGILAAVALPQYRKAVEKSKGAQALVLMNTIVQALQAHYMASGAFPRSFDELAVDMNAWTGTEKWSTNGSSTFGTLDVRSNEDWSLQLYKTGAGALAVYLGRLSGKYSGGGFVEEVISNEGKLTANQLVCAERKSAGVVFNAHPNGSYCEKIWKATYNPDGAANTYREYIMP